jgi:diguanylate cyclase (GGDEF)-like protein
VLGVLQVSNRLGEASAFGRDDLQLLQTLAAHTEVIWHNGRLLEQLRHDAHHDSLTGLGNRSRFRAALNAHLSSLPAADQETDASVARAAVLLLDLDRFKEVNDTLGHPVGDELLRLVARRVVEYVPPEATVVRLGGDEFAVLLPHVTDERPGADVAAAIRGGLTGPFEVQGTRLEVGASIGVAVIPDDGRDASTLLQHADVAMYVAKRLTSGVARYETHDDRSSVHRLAMAGDLRRAMAEGQVVMHMQPQTSLETGRVVCWEALARWERPGGGTVMPDEFIPLAEQTGLIGALTHVALVQALRLCSSWLDTSPDMGVAVNLSPRQLLDPELSSTVSEVLEASGVPARLLTLEITETSIMTDPTAAAAALGTLRELGVRLPSTTSAPGTPPSRTCSACRWTSSRSTSPSCSP